MRTKEKREKILSAAEKLFAKKGFFRATVDDVAKASGITKGTIYLYFKNKGDLFTSVVLKTFSLIEGDIESCSSSGEELSEILHCIMKKVRRRISKGRKHREHILRTGRAGLPPETIKLLRKEVRPAMKRIKEEMSDIFRRFKDEIKAYTPKELSRIFFALVLVSGELEKPAIHSSALEIFLNGIKKERK